MDIDLRSDTVTRPTSAMRQAMMAAPLGDDVLGDEPTVQALEAKVAALLGKEAALFTPSGTMANQLAIRCQTEPGDEIVAHAESHIIHYETGSPAALSGCMIRSLDGPRGQFNAEAVHAAIRGSDIHSPRSRLLVLENTQNRAGGTVWPLDAARTVATAARTGGLSIHIDGARLFNASVAAGYSVASFASLADTVSVCFSKGLGAPVGSALCGPALLITRARRFRKMFGGGMRQSGLLAAACIHALDHHVKQLAHDHANARHLATLLQGIPGLRLDPGLDGIETNMVFFSIDPSLGTATEVCTRLAAAGVRMIPMGARRIRAVTHLDVDRAAIERAAGIVRSMLARGAP
ncbi:MAG: aminotransferase class I/II-fold pyridoxal phosphate-dependent enzyme [Planctomycetes bacterium]|nr:aminotransferase class I/II-fold pyridoxal phosphate-dependent enzyme [Planctomycetota bacterium]